MSEPGDQPPQQGYPQYQPQPGYQQPGYPPPGNYPPPGGYPPYGYPPGGGYGGPGWQPKRRGGLATASLVLGIIGFILAVIPFANFIAYPLVILAIIFGLLAVQWGKAKAGLILGSLGLLATIAWTIGITVFFNNATNNPHTVVYRVTGSIGSADVDYYTENAGGKDAQQTQNSAPLPFTRTFDVKGDLSGFDLSASAPIDESGVRSGSLACSIAVDGKVVSRDSASGTGDVVSCYATGYDGN